VNHELELQQQPSSHLSQWTTTRQFLQSLKIISSPSTSQQLHYVITSPFAKTLIPARQGPYLLQPTSRDITSGNEDEIATDLWISQSDDDPTWMIITFAHGKVDVLVELEAIEPRWMKDDLQESDFLSPCLTTIDTIDFTTVATRTTPMVCVADGLYNDIVYLVHEAGIHALHSRPWLTLLQECLMARCSNQEEDEMLLHEKVLHFLPPSTLRFLLDTRVPGSNPQLILTPPSSTTQPKAVIHVIEPYLGYMLLILTSMGRLIPLELFASLPSNPPPLFLKRPVSEGGGPLQSPLRASPFEQTLTRFMPPSSSSALPLCLPKMILPQTTLWSKKRYPECVNEESLDVFLSYLATLRLDYFKSLLKLSREMGDR
jgi:hypothetical protein